MKVLTVYAHHNPRSFCHAVLERFDAGLRDAGHTNEIVDLHAIGFDPVLRDADGPNWIDDSVPDDVLAGMRLPQSMFERARGPIQRLLLKRWIGKVDARGIRQVEHEYFYAVHGANAATLEKYLARAYALGKDFGG